jgi:hypothetical protein
VEEKSIMTKTEAFENSPRAVARNEYWLWWVEATKPTPEQLAAERVANRLRARQELVDNYGGFGVSVEHMAATMAPWEC